MKLEKITLFVFSLTVGVSSNPENETSNMGNCQGCRCVLHNSVYNEHLAHTEYSKKTDYEIFRKNNSINAHILKLAE